jgi:hypothetical protein
LGVPVSSTFAIGLSEVGVITGVSLTRFVGDGVNATPECGVATGDLVSMGVSVTRGWVALVDSSETKAGEHPAKNKSTHTMIERFFNIIAAILLGNRSLPTIKNTVSAHSIGWGIGGDTLP